MVPEVIEGSHKFLVAIDCFPGTTALEVSTKDGTATGRHDGNALRPGFEGHERERFVHRELHESTGPRHHVCLANAIQEAEVTGPRFTGNGERTLSHKSERESLRKLLGVPTSMVEDQRQALE